jgi:hypothetical protein
MKKMTAIPPYANIRAQRVMNKSGRSRRGGIAEHQISDADSCQSSMQS